MVAPRSRCPRCRHQIAWYDNVPLVSWLLLRGKCRQCSLPISVQYPLVELVVALFWVACVVVFGPTLEALRIAIFGTLLLGVAVTDAKHYLIPDGFTVFGLIFLLVMSIVTWFRLEPSLFASPWAAFIGACAGAGAITIVGWLAEVVMKREAMGFGDATLMAMVGAAVGAERALLTILIGAFIGAAFFLLVVAPVLWIRAARTRSGFEFPDVPFGVFLAPAALFALLWGQPLIAWYLRHALP